MYCSEDKICLESCFGKRDTSARAALQNASLGLGPNQNDTLDNPISSGEIWLHFRVHPKQMLDNRMFVKHTCFYYLLWVYHTSEDRIGVAGHHIHMDVFLGVGRFY